MGRYGKVALKKPYPGMVRKPQMSQLLRVFVPHGTKPSPILFCCIQL